MDCIFRRRASKSEAVITVKRGDIGVYAYRFNGAYVTIDGVDYKRAAEVTVPVGTVITLSGTTYGKSSDPGTVSFYIGETLVSQQQASAKATFTYEYSVQTDITVKLTVTGSTNDYDAEITVTET